MQDKEKLTKLCVMALHKKGLKNNDKYKNRLKYELKQINIHEEHEYFVDLYDRKIKYPVNENNLLVPYLLDIVDEVNIEEEPHTVQGEFPDIDIDYIKPVRDYLKKEWAPKEFGAENVCSIATYGTMGIKNSILDMTKVHGGPKDVIQAITVKMEDKDDEGQTLEWDKALEMYEDFKNFCEEYPDIAAAAKLMQKRNKSGGVHAGGYIISSKRLDGFVPLEVRGVNKDNPAGSVVSAWTEGLGAQDLQPVGLIKFDLLVIMNLMQVALACKLIKERHPEVKSICAAEGQDEDWSDTSYLNDPKAIEMANKADLKCIFQFDGEGIQKLVKRGGVSSFDDLVAYSAMFRPGPLNCLRKGTRVCLKSGYQKIEELKTYHDEIKYISKDGSVKTTNKFLLTKTGKKKLLKIKTKRGNVIYVSPDHEVLSEKGFKKAEFLILGEKIGSINHT